MENLNVKRENYEKLEDFAFAAFSYLEANNLLESFLENWNVDTDFSRLTSLDGLRVIERSILNQAKYTVPEHIERERILNEEMSI